MGNIPAYEWDRTVKRAKQYQRPHDWSGVTIDGVTMSLRQWAKVNRINYVTVCTRIRRGWDRVAAVTWRAKAGWSYRDRVEVKRRNDNGVR